GISTFDLSRYMGASLTMIDRHYGHLARDGREHAIRLLDEMSAGQPPRWTLVDAAWTPPPAAAGTGGRGAGAGAPLVSRPAAAEPGVGEAQATRRAAAASAGAALDRPGDGGGAARA